MKHLNRTLALALSLICAVATFPTSALADVLEAQATATPVLMYRTHAVDAAMWQDDEGWVLGTPDELRASASEEPNPTDQTPANSDGVNVGDEGTNAEDDQTGAELPLYVDELLIADDLVDEATAEETVEDPEAANATNPSSSSPRTSSPGALDSLEIKLSDNQTGVEYRVRDEEGTWQEQWSQDGMLVEGPAFTGIEVKLSSELEDAYDIWYRVAGSDGVWLEWVQGQGGALTPSDEAITKFEGIIVDKGVDIHALLEDQVIADDDASQAAPDDEDQTEVDLAEQEEEVAIEPLEDDVVDITGDEGVGETAEELEEEVSLSLQETSPATEEKVTTTKPTTSTTASSSKVGSTTSTTSSTKKTTAVPRIEYRAHVQKKGWLAWVKNGAVAGTTGKSLRLESLKLRLKNASGNISAQAYVQGKGWLSPVSANKLVGTTGKSLRMEALKISLTGNVSKNYDVWYRVHMQKYGWLTWVRNGSTSGKAGKSLRIEAVEVMLVPKGGTIPTGQGSAYTDSSTTKEVGVHYQAKLQNLGWRGEVQNGKTSGSTTKSLRMEAIRIRTTGINANVSYRGWVQGTGWTSWTSNGKICGKTGKRLEALRIKLTGTDAAKYDIYYRGYVQKVGWTSWASNGEACGSHGYSYRLEALQIRLVLKTKAAPSNASAATKLKCLAVPSVSYRLSIVGSGWQSAKSNGATAGETKKSTRTNGLIARLGNYENGGIAYSVRTTGLKWTSWYTNGAKAKDSSSRNLTGIRMKLTGNLTSTYSIWYRVYLSGKGWLGWASNSAYAGIDVATNPVTAIQVKVLKKGKKPGSTVQPYIYTQQLNGVDISGHNAGIDTAALGADFVIVKATEGSKNATQWNPDYKKMADTAYKSGKLIGFYHYANGGNATKEADAFCDAVKGYKGKAILFLDWEGVGNPKFLTSYANNVTWCKTFLDRVRTRTGGTPFLYTSKSVTSYYNWSTVANTYPLWGAQYASNNPVYGYQANPWQSTDAWGVWGTKPTIFQYSGNGRLTNNGGSEALDLNLFYGTRTDWSKYVMTKEP